MLVVAGVQLVLNQAAVAVEVEHPTPFGVDLVKILDEGTPLDETGRCALLAGVPQSLELPGWRDTLNRQYASRHGVVFCDDRSPPSLPRTSLHGLKRSPALRLARDVRGRTARLSRGTFASLVRWIRVAAC